MKRSVRGERREGSGTMHVRRFAIAAAALAIGLIAGCGEDEKAPAQKSFKGVSDGDMRTLGDVSARLREFSAAYTDFVAASTKEDVDAAGESVDGMGAAVDEASSSAAAIE